MSSPQNFDVFLSHNSKEKQAVERIAEKLKRVEIEPWLDKWCLTASGDWQDELAKGLRFSSSCAVFVGPNGIGDWERLEFKLATDRMAKDRNFRVFLVLLPELPEPFDTSTLPPFLTTRTWVDLRQGFSDSRTFQQLINAIKGLAPGPEMPIEPRNEVCPYRGLQAFDEEHAEFFFGRDGDIQRLVEKLKTTRLLAVLGASGSGKTSLVRAGLLPAIKKGALSGSDAWSIRVFTPGARPLTQLTANLQRLYPQATAGKMLDELSVDERTLHLQSATILADRPSAELLVWVVDQFEEVFTLCSDEAERKQFIANLLYAALAPGGRDVVLLTMRADFYQKCAAYPEFSAQISAQQFLVSPMSLEGLRQAISEPAWRTGLEFEPGLVETILDDVESQPGALPLLEHALLELWERRRARLLTLEAYQESGGVAGAIAKRADTIYESFDAERQSIVRRIMLRLTQPGEGTEDTRRRATMSELITHAGEADKVESVVQAMADARLLMTDSGADGGSEIVDVSHEALIRSWPRLRRWIDEDRQGLRVLRRVTEAAQEWQKGNNDESLLFRGARLAQAVELRRRSEAALNDQEREFLTASAELRDREQLIARRRTRRIIIYLVIALVLISAASIYALIQSRIAAQRGTEGRARELAANAMAQLPVDPELALILAIEAAKTAHSPETENTLRQALARAPMHVFQARISFSSHKANGSTFSPDGKNVLIANGEKLDIYDTESGRTVSQIQEMETLNSIAYSPDGKLIATTSAGTVNILDAATGYSLISRHREEESVFSKLSVFSPDGGFLVLGSREINSTGGDTRVMEVSSGRIVAELDGGDPTFSRDGKLLFTQGGKQGGLGGAELFLYDAGDWKLLAKIPTTFSIWEGGILGALSPDGTRVFAGMGEYVGVYDINSKRVLGKLRVAPEGKDAVSAEEATPRTEGATTTPAFSPDGKLIAFASHRKLVLWDTSSWKSSVLGGLSGPLLELSFSPDSRFLLATDGQAHLYDVQSKRLLAEFGVASGAATVAAKFSPNGKYVMTDTASGTISLWDLNPWRSMVAVDTRTADTNTKSSSIFSAELSPDEKLSITTRQSLAGGGSVTRVWDLGSGQITSEIMLPSNQLMKDATLSPDGKLIMTVAKDNGTVRTWDSSSGQAIFEFKIDDLANEPVVPIVKQAEFSPDGKFLVTRGRQKIELRDANTGQILAELKAASYYPPVVSTNGKLILFTDDRGMIVMDIASKQIVLAMPGLQGNAITFSPDDKFILGEWDYLEVRNAGTGGVVAELRGHVDSLNTAVFSTDGRYVVTATEFSSSGEEITPENANEVRVWDAGSGSAIYEFRDHAGPVQFAKFSRDGKLVLATDRDGTIRVYACGLCVSPDEMLKLAQKRRLRELTPDERARYLRE